MLNSLTAKINSLKVSYLNLSVQQQKIDLQAKNEADHEFSASTKYSPNSTPDIMLSKINYIFSNLTQI